jgi:signal transduction histidine kinase
LAASAVQLPWLAPGVAALAALARPTRPAARRTVRADPAALLLLHSHSPPDQPPTTDPLGRRAAAALPRALALLSRPPAGVLDRRHRAVRAALTAARRTARVAYGLAVRSGRADPEAAWTAGMLAPLGWLAVAAVRPDAVAACLDDAAFAREPAAVQKRRWGLTAPEIARRLARRWELPAWLAAAAGHLDLPADFAPSVGADPALFAITQAAVVIADRHGRPLRLAVGTALDELLGRLGIDPGAADQEALVASVPAAGADWAAGNPYAARWLPDLLELAVENADRRGTHLVPLLEGEIDRLHRLLLDQRAGEAERLRGQKLAALAEFAAGAGHEINNPLAVISGQAQYLLGQESDPDRQKSLRAVVQQAQRVHQILTDLMQFARPARPQKQALDVRDLALGVVAVHEELAAQRPVRIELLLPDEACVTDGDPKQLHTALACLLRNAIEAAPADGWARVRVEPSAERLRVVVEDSGPGPTAAQAEHLFDPFYSGRPAGRGRGLGLPTAWRLAREQGGDVWYEPVPGGPTRFVLALPRVTTLPLPQPPERLSA